MTQIIRSFDEVWQKYGDVFDENMKIHQTIYPNEGHQDLKSQINEVIDKFNKRIALLDNLMLQYESFSDIQSTSQKPTILGITDYMGHRYQNRNNMPRGLYIYQYNDGTIKKRVIK